MKLRPFFVPALVVSGILSAGVVCAAQSPQPPGVADALQNLVSEPSSHNAMTFDHDMLASAAGFLGGQGAKGPAAALDSITFENYRYREPAFYIPEAMSALYSAYHKAGWTHLVDQNASPRDSASPQKPITDLWLHFRGADIDHVTVLIRGVKQMNLIEVSGDLRPLDLVHLGGHFGIPRVDPGAVMVPAPPGK